MLSLPGARWKQLNNDRDDARLWKEKKISSPGLRILASTRRTPENTPAIVAYNPLNEPHPDKAFGLDAPDENFARWFKRIQNTPADLNQFNREMVKAIRSVDKDTPIILDGWFYASPQAFEYNRPVDDERVLYAFHNPGPWQMVTYRVNQGRYAYPDRVPKSWNGPTESWTIDRLAREMQAVQQFSEQYNIPAHRIIASEFWYGPSPRRRSSIYGRPHRNLQPARAGTGLSYAFRGSGTWTGTRLRNRARSKNGMALLASH